MASHSGLKYILETKKGYVRKDGGFTFKKEEALLIDFWQFGFGPSALEVYKRLGFNNEDVLDSGVSFKTIIPSYEGRDYIGVSYYMLMGFDYNMAVEKAIEDCYKYNLMDDNNCLRYEEMLKANVLSYYQSRKNVDKVLDTSEGKILLYKVGDKEEVLGGILEEYYSEKGSIYRYSLPLKNPHVERYFNITEDKAKEYNHFQQDGLVDYFIKRFNEEKFNWGLNYDTKILDIKIVDDRLEIVLDDWSNINGNKVARKLNEVIRDFYSKKEMHITRMFGSYVILERIDGELKAVEATPVPIKYCPLMVKLLREVGGSNSDEFIAAIRTENVDVQVKMMCELIDNVVIKGGYFDTKRPLNSCEANVLFGASETISSAFKSNMLDASVIVSNNLGTIITTNDTNTQGAVKRMTGLFYTSPDKNIMEEAINSKIIPVFPYSAKIDQVEGVKEAIRRGYKRIAVTLAAYDNELWEEIAKLEKNGIVIYKFGLCSTGISRKTAQMMLENADIVWSCASKYVKELIEPNAIAQVGIKIPVHIMTEKGWELVRNHLAFMVSQEIEDATLLKGDEKPVFLNSEDGIKRLVKKDIKRCNDCPNPCI